MEYVIFFSFVVLAVILFFTIPWVMYLISHGLAKDFLCISGRTIPIRSKATDKRVFDYIRKLKKFNSKIIKTLNLNVVDNLEVHFVGSMAYYFDELIREIAKHKEVRVKKIIRHPINHLAEYFLENKL